MLEIQSTQYVLWGDDVYTSEVSVGEESHKGMMGNFFGGLERDLTVNKMLIITSQLKILFW